MRELVLENYVNNAIKARVTWEAQYFLFFFSSLSLAPRSRSDEKSSLSLSLSRRKDKRGMEYSKITVTTLRKTDIITVLPGKNVSISLCPRSFNYAKCI